MTDAITEPTYSGVAIAPNVDQSQLLADLSLSHLPCAKENKSSSKNNRDIRGGQESQSHLGTAQATEQVELAFKPTNTTRLHEGTCLEDDPKQALSIELGRLSISTPPTSIPQSRQKKQRKARAIVTIPPLPITIMNPTRLFIASLGNPAPYTSTRHSAGHTLLKALQSHLLLPPFHKSKTYANGLCSIGAEAGQPEYTLWQSPSLMNISGVALLKAYKTFISTAQESTTAPLPGLIVLYDEMETTPGQLRLRRGATSAKGHNGLKSVQQSFQSAGLLDKLGDRFVKIGIGIGRPHGGSRSSEDVSRYVLGQLTSGEKEAIDGKASELARLLEAEMLRMSK